jgi:hypothetical protein
MNQTVRSLIKFNHPIFDEIEINCLTFKKQEYDDEYLLVTFDLQFEINNSGYSFPCDSAGNVCVENLSVEGRKNYDFALLHAERGRWQNICVRPYIKRYRTCDCGSGEIPEEEYDARGIYLCRACPSCRSRKLRGYRQDVLTNSNYECGELIEADY